VAGVAIPKQAGRAQGRRWSFPNDITNRESEDALGQPPSVEEITTNRPTGTDQAASANVSPLQSGFGNSASCIRAANFRLLLLT
jgi:hypothetical protein